MGIFHGKYQLDRLCYHKIGLLKLMVEAFLLLQIIKIKIPNINVLILPTFKFCFIFHGKSIIPIGTV